MNPLLRSRTQSGVASAVDRTERKSAQGGQVERVLVAEIGSTTTVVNAFSLGNRPRFLGQGQAATSVADGDVRIGLRAAIRALAESLSPEDRKIDANGELHYDRLLATSSAAGGLKMTVHGLVYDMTSKAAKEAALGAGANIHLVTAGRLRRSDIKEILRIRPNIILIAGGVDYGERDTALFNAEQLAALDLDVPVLYAGNIQNHEEIREIFEEAGKAHRLYIVENVFPKIDQLRVEPARKVIQAIFAEHIVHAPGMEAIRELVSGTIIPTPGAVMEASILLEREIGDLMTVDVGGATTDIHSVTEGSDEIARILLAPEPKAKRTVEGDLGLYVNFRNVVALVGEATLCRKLGITEEELRARMETHPPIPRSKEEIAFAEMLAEEAIRVSATRHAGVFRSMYGGGGKKTYAEGKDLTSVRTIVGTGGAATRLPARRQLLHHATDNPLGDRLLPPTEVRILIDNHYIMASLGVLSKEYPEAALALLLDSLGIPRDDRNRPQATESLTGPHDTAEHKETL